VKLRRLCRNWWDDATTKVASSHGCQGKEATRKKKQINGVNKTKKKEWGEVPRTAALLGN